MSQQAVKVSSAQYEALKKAAALHSRSVSGQAEHWIRLGRAVELNPDVAYSAIDSALRGLDQEAPGGPAGGQLPAGVHALPGRALAFQAAAHKEISRSTALRRHPELRPAFDDLALAEIKHRHEPKILAGILEHLQERLNRGEIPAQRNQA